MPVGFFSFLHSTPPTNCNKNSKYLFVLLSYCGSEQRKEYSDSLRANQFGNRIPVWASFSAPVLTGPGEKTSHPCHGYRVIPGGKTTESWR